MCVFCGPSGNDKATLNAFDEDSPVQVTTSKMTFARMYKWMKMSALLSTSRKTHKMRQISYKHIIAVSLAVLAIMISSASSKAQYKNRNKRLVTHANSNNRDSSIFIQLPYSNPPTVKAPPYYESNEKCPPLNLRENWIDTLCGDLNSGYIPLNPMGHTFPDGASYPFEVIKNKTLDFFRRALPILKSDKSLPKVAKFNPYEVNGLVNTPEQYHYRMKRSASMSTNSSSSEKLSWLMPPSNLSTSRSSNDAAAEKKENELLADAVEGRSGPGLFGVGSGNLNRRQQYGRFCDTTNPLTPGALSYFNRFCKLYNSMWGKQPYQSHYVGPTVIPHIGGGNSLQRYDHDINYQHRIISNGPMHYHAAVPSTSFKRPPPPPPINSQLMPQPPSFRRHRYEALHSADANLDMPLSASSATGANAAAAAASMPPTPCPSQVEYLTPVFARNHEGSWRYIVQIPREGYFTQTVEVTKCVETNCFYMDGDCKSSPRWQSLLVAEMYYPDTSFPTTTSTTSTTATPNPLVPSYENSNENSEYHKYQQYLKKKLYDGGSGFEYDTSYERRDRRKRKSRKDSSSSSTSAEIPPECDGIDHIGCFQVRLFYDWFLIPGSCKCWRRTFDFTRVHHNNRLNH